VNKADIHKEAVDNSVDSVDYLWINVDKPFLFKIYAQKGKNIPIKLGF